MRPQNLRNFNSPVQKFSDHLYQYRNLWDQHPWPAQPNEFPNLNYPATGYCSVAANQGTGACHPIRRPLGNLFSGGDCETDASAFTWPLDPNTEGFRVLPPNGTAEPISVFLREPLSGTYVTTEYTEIRRYGTPGGSLGTNGSGVYERTPYLSQETNVVVGQSDTNPLDLQCPAKFGGEGTSTEGFRMRAISTTEVINGPNYGTDISSGDGIYYTPDSIGYAFFSFGNVSKIAAKAKYGYLLIDSIDPLFDNYQNAAQSIAGGSYAPGTIVEGEPPTSAGVPANVNPGQPASDGTPLSWGELPICGGTGQPVCTATGIWGGIFRFRTFATGLTQRGQN